MCDLLVMNMIGGFSLQAILVYGYVFGICVIICGSADFANYVESGNS